MPAIPVSRDNAWTYWSKGLISATNIDMTANSSDATNVLASLANKRGHNAIRLWFGYAEKYSIQEADITAIAKASNGWDSEQKTSAAGSDGTITYKWVSNHIQLILDTCQKLGMGVIFVTNYNQGAGGALWNSQSGYGENLTNFWLKTYNKWGLHPAVIGFDLLNEPELSRQELSFKDARNSDYEWPKLAQRLITAIRNLEDLLRKNRPLLRPLPLVVEGVYTGGTRSLGVFDSGSELFLKDPKGQLVFSFHYYDPGCFTHQGVTDWSYEELGATYPLPGVWQRSYWYDGEPCFELKEYRTVGDLDDNMHVINEFAENHGVPIFVGEFSAVQPTLNYVYPVSPGSQREVNFPSQRVSEVQNTVQWEAPLLDKLTSIRGQSDFDALTADERRNTYGIWTRCNRRWITKLEVGQDGYMTATIGSVITPGSELSTGFRVGFSSTPLAELKRKYPIINENPGSGYDSWGRENAPMTDEFYSEPKARIRGPVNARAAGLLVSEPQKVTLLRHASTIRFKAPEGAVKGEVILGAECQVPNEGGSTTIVMPVALLWLDSPHSEAEIDQARFTYARDLISLFQAKGYSWAWHCDDTNSSMAQLSWRASGSISELLAVASSGRKLARRN